MTFYRSEITINKPLLFDADIDLSDACLSKAYPLLGIGKTHFKGSIMKIDGILHLLGKLDSLLTLSDARTLRRVSYRLEKEVECDLLSSEEEEGEGYIFPENRIELSEVALSLILTYMPRTYSTKKLTKESGEGYTVYSEGDETPFGNAFSSLNPDDFE